MGVGNGKITKWLRASVHAGLALCYGFVNCPCDPLCEIERRSGATADGPAMRR